MRIHFAFRISQRGIALMAVMIAIFVLSVLAGAFAYAMKVETKLAMNSQRESTDVYECGQSGVAVAKAFMAAYNSPACTCIHRKQKWAGYPGDAFETNGPMAEFSLDQQGNMELSGVPFPFRIKFTDLGGKININMATPEVLQQALMLAGAQGGEIGAISSAIVDWIDADDNEGVNGAESPYYQSQDPPYFAKNGPMDDLSELLKVRGVTKEMYYGTESNDAGGEAQGSFQRRDRLGRLVQGTTPTVGLCKVFTTFSSGRKANVNTARTEVLQALGFDEAMAVELVRRRDEAPFTSVNELKGQVEQMAPQFLPIVDNWCEARGSIFEVEITPKVGFRRTFHAIIGPGNNPREMQVFSFFWKWNEEENSSR